MPSSGSNSNSQNDDCSPRILETYDDDPSFCSVAVPRRERVEKNSILDNVIESPLSAQEVLQDQQSSWIANDCAVTLPSLPNNYVLARTHVVVINKKISTIARQIKDCLRRVSVAAKYEIWMVKAETMDHTQFSIHIFAHQSQGIIVELSRYSGCSISFHDYANVILNAIQGNIVPINRRLPKTISTASSRDQMSILQSLEIVSSLLKKDRIDANMLGMESLRKLTDSHSIGQTSAQSVARIVLQEHGNNFDDVRKKLLSFVIHDWGYLVKEGVDYDDKFYQRHHNIMHNHALAIVGNSFAMIGCTENSDRIRQQESLVQKILPAIIDGVKHALTRPHDAFLATRCLKSIIQVSVKWKTMAMNLGAMDVLRQSEIAGHCSHKLLALESEKAINELLEKKSSLRGYCNAVCPFRTSE